MHASEIGRRGLPGGLADAWPWECSGGGGQPGVGAIDLHFMRIHLSLALC